MPDGFEGDVYFESNGSLTEHRLLGGQEVIVLYADIPEKDVTTVDGLPCTTALRTVIDIAADVDRAQLDRIVQDCLRPMPVHGGGGKGSAGRARHGE